MLARQNRLTRKADFERVFAVGAAVHHHLLSLRSAPNELDNVRLGLNCGKRVGGAVVRNRARRRLRAAVRSLVPSLPAGQDILLVIRPPGASASVAEFFYALEELLRRRGLAGARKE